MEVLQRLIGGAVWPPVSLLALGTSSTGDHRPPGGRGGPLWYPCAITPKSTCF